MPSSDRALVPTIVCALRGGEGSRRAQELAVALGKERGVPVVFLHVVDTDLVARIDSSISETVEDELERLGASLLSIALERASAQGVVADMVVKRGSVVQVLEEYMRDSRASTLVVGAPGSDSPPDTFSEGQMREFVERLQMVAGCQVIIA
jgi:nucleotide-binding universal stress UspA family protein